MFLSFKEEMNAGQYEYSVIRFPRLDSAVKYGGLTAGENVREGTYESESERTGAAPELAV